MSPTYTRAILRTLAGVLGFGLLLGCNLTTDAPERYDVKGKVTFDGRPIPYGTINFIPTKGNSGPAGNATISDGNFNTAEAGQGIVGGPHRVVITGFDGIPKPDQELPHGEPLFPEYSTEHDFPPEASGQQPLNVDFQVPKAAGKSKR